MKIIKDKNSDLTISNEIGTLNIKVTTINIKMNLFDNAVYKVDSVFSPDLDERRDSDYTDQTYTAPTYLYLKGNIENKMKRMELTCSV